MLKKASVVVAAAAALAMIGGPAFATTSSAMSDSSPSATVPGPAPDWPTYGDAFNQFVMGGGALGYGAASLVAGAYTGIILTPAEVEHNFQNMLGN